MSPRCSVRVVETQSETHQVIVCTLPTFHTLFAVGDVICGLMTMSSLADTAEAANTMLAAARRVLTEANMMRRDSGVRAV